MRIAKMHSQKHGLELLRSEKPQIVHEIQATIETINAVDCLTKISREKTRQRSPLLISPGTLNLHFRKTLLESQGWLQRNDKTGRYKAPRIMFTDDDESSNGTRFREMDGLKDRVGLEIQFGKYAFMGYDIFGKMVIFKSYGLIDYGIEIVVIQEMLPMMSTGVSAFEQIMIDFRHRGEADIDIPVWVIGIGMTESEATEISTIRRLYADDPALALATYPQLGRTKARGEKPGPNNRGEWK